MSPIWVQYHMGLKCSKWVLYPDWKVEQFVRDGDNKRIKQLVPFDYHFKYYDVELKDFNLVQIPKGLVIIDIDEKVIEDNEKALLVMQKRLEEDGITYDLYKTGGKGFHFHLFFEELLHIDDSFLITRIKKEIISKYGKGFKVDLLKAGKKNLIGIEDCIHRNGKGYKLLVSNYENEEYPNMIPIVIRKKKAIKGKFLVAMNSFDMNCIGYLQENPIPEGYRDNVLFSLISHWKHRHTRDELIKITSDFVSRNGDFISEGTILLKIDNALQSSQRTGCSYNKILLEGLGCDEICKKCKYKDE